MQDLRNAVCGNDMHVQPVNDCSPLPFLLHLLFVLVGYDHESVLLSFCPAMVFARKRQ